LSISKLLNSTVKCPACEGKSFLKWVKSKVR
jgi:hypothetical protein